MSSNQIIKKSKQFLEELATTADQFTKNFSSEFASFKTDKQSNTEELKSLWNQIEQQISEVFSSMSAKSSEAMGELGQIQGLFQKGWETISDTFEHRARYWDAMQTIFLLMGRYKAFQIQSANLPESERLQQAEELHQQNAEELAALCRKQGGAWVKAAQFISCHYGELPQVYRDELASLQDQADPIDWEKIELVLQETLGNNWQERFSSIDKTPLATASIGQVHKAQLCYGPVVALKVQIPGVSELVHADLKFFELVASLLNSQFEILDLEQVVRELSKSILKELDYYNEASNLTQFFSSYENQQWEYPILIKELLTSRTLGMYFIDGMPIRQFLQEVPNAAEPVLKELVHSFFKQLFINGLFHADPHPGNFFVTPQGKIALLDFGAIGYLTKAETKSYRDVLVALLLEKHEKIDTLLQEAGFVCPDPEKLKQLLSQRKSDEFNELTKMQYYLEVMRQAQVKIPDNFVLMARVLIVIGGLLRQHHVKLDLSELALMLMTSQ